MAGQTPRQQASKLINVFNAQWKEKYGKQYVGNRHSDQWGFLDMISDLGYRDAKQVVEYYFNLSSDNHHDRKWLIYNYEKVYTTKLQVEADRQHRRNLMEQTKRMMEEE